MKVAFNVTPLSTASKTRGIGSYTKNLLENLKKKIKIIEFTDIKTVGEVDLVHYPWFDLFFNTLKLDRRFPTVVTIHDVTPLVFAKNYPVGVRGKVNLFFQKKSLKSCSAIITDSNASKNGIIKYLGVNEDKIKVIPLASDKKFKILTQIEKEAIKNKLKLPDKYLLYVGDVNFVKNLPYLIKEFNKLIRRKNFQEYKLILVGGAFLRKVNNFHPELKSAIEVNQLIKDYKLAGKIIKPGQISDDDLVGVYNLATVYIQSSLYEGFGLPILEAMNCGTPVLSSLAGSLPEVGSNAVIYFNPLKADDLLSNLVNLLSNKDLQRGLSNLGIKRSRLFSWNKTANQTIKVYEAINKD